MKTAYLVHGWEGSPNNNWFPWLKSKLEQQGFRVLVPAMPDPETPDRAAWTKALLDLISDPDEDTYLVGHSMGCQAIQRYLESLPEDKIIGGAVLVAGWVNDPKWEGRTAGETEVVEDWYNQTKDYEAIKRHCKKFVSIYSTNDPFVPKQNWEESESILNAKVIMVENKSHFDDEAGITELPEALAAVLEISK